MRPRTHDNETGFTLIELLVVVIIIGILSAIAIPTFLNQREAGWKAQLASDARNAVLEVEAAFAMAGGIYPVNQVAFDALPHSISDPGTTLTYTVNGARNEICVVADHPLLGVGDEVAYASSFGGIQDGPACPAFNSP